MILLTIDTASPFCSVALIEGDSALKICKDTVGKGHAEHLLPQIAQLMRDTGKNFADIDYIAVNTGPGSFTGLRAGVAAARAAALALQKPAIGISAFSAFHAQALSQFHAACISEEERKTKQTAQMPAPPKSIAVYVILQAGQNRFYWQYFPAGGGYEQPQSSDAAALSALIQRHERQEEKPHSGGSQPKAALIGTGAEAAAALLPPEQAAEFCILPAEQTADSIFFAAAAKELIAEGTVSTENRPVPLYMRSADAKPQPSAPLTQIKSQFRAPQKIKSKVKMGGKEEDLS